MRRLRGKTFKFQMSNVQTWVSVALTNEETCLDGFEGVDRKVKSDVKKMIMNVAKDQCLSTGQGFQSPLHAVADLHINSLPIK
ncbi:hypothetical protein V6N13_114639 [Hibiscus sabdariffa]